MVVRKATTSGRVKRKSRYRLSMISRPPWPRSTAAAAVTPGPAGLRPITKTISGSPRGWMRRSRRSGPPLVMAMHESRVTKPDHFPAWSRSRSVPHTNLAALATSADVPPFSCTATTIG